MNNLSAYAEFTFRMGRLMIQQRSLVFHGAKNKLMVKHQELQDWSKLNKIEPISNFILEHR